MLDRKSIMFIKLPKRSSYRTIKTNNSIKLKVNSQGKRTILRRKK